MGITKRVPTVVLDSAYRILIADSKKRAKKYNLKDDMLVFVSTGKDCIRKALNAKRAGNVFDIIVLDSKLPDLDGYSCAMKLKVNDCADLIVSMSDTKFLCEEELSIESGCDYHFQRKEVYKNLLPTLAVSKDS